MLGPLVAQEADEGRYCAIYIYIVYWCLLFVLIRQGLRGRSGPLRLIRAPGIETGNPRTPDNDLLPSFVACHPAAAYNLPGGVPKWTLGFPFSGGLGDAPCRRRQQNARRTSGIVKITQASPFQGVWGIPPAAGGKRTQVEHQSPPIRK